MRLRATSFHSVAQRVEVLLERADARVSASAPSAIGLLAVADERELAAELAVERDPELLGAARRESRMPSATLVASSR